MFEDFINGNNLIYYRMFLDQMVNYLLLLYSKFRSDLDGNNFSTENNSKEILISELEAADNLEKNLSNYKKIIYFQFSLMTEEQFQTIQ